MCRRNQSGGPMSLQYHADKTAKDDIKCGIPVRLCNSIR
jgi:hypothetical protein